MVEENFFLPILTRQLVSPVQNWAERIARDLDHPKFKTTFFEAIGFRLYRNYLWIYMILLLGWVLKLFIHPTEARSFGTLYERMALGPIPSWLVLAFCLMLCAAILAALVASHRRGVVVDEIRGLEQDLAQWKV